MTLYLFFVSRIVVDELRGIGEAFSLLRSAVRGFFFFFGLIDLAVESSKIDPIPLSLLILLLMSSEK